MHGKVLIKPEDCFLRSMMQFLIYDKLSTISGRTMFNSHDAVKGHVAKKWKVCPSIILLLFASGQSCPIRTHSAFMGLVAFQREKKVQ